MIHPLHRKSNGYPASRLRTGDPLLGFVEYPLPVLVGYPLSALAGHPLPALVQRVVVLVMSR
jgi:hypothetical protein